MTEFVKYIGTAHRRIITADDFRRAGYPDMETVEWSYHNGFSVPADRFGDDVIEKVLKADPSFVVLGGEEHAPQFLGQRMTPAQASAPRIDMMGAVEPESGSAAISSGRQTGSGPTPGGGGSSRTTVTTGDGSASDSP